MKSLWDLLASFSTLAQSIRGLPAAIDGMTAAIEDRTPPASQDDRTRGLDAPPALLHEGNGGRRKAAAR